MEKLKRAFFRWEPFQPHRETVLDLIRSRNPDSFQRCLCEKLDFDDEFPVEPKSGESFVKRLITLLEEREIEVIDELYELLQKVQRIHASDISHFYYYYKTYFIIGDVQVHLSESREFLCQGSTGLRTWEAAEFLLRYLQKGQGQRTNDDGKRPKVLELGSGVGYLGIGALKCRLAEKFVFTDYHESVLRKLTHNCRVNLGGADSDYEIRSLDWESFRRSEEIADLGDFDLVLATDVTFDPEIIPHLVKTIKICLGKATEAIVACTVRNRDTLTGFVNKVKEEEMLITLMNDDVRDSVSIYTLKLQ